MTCRLAAYRAGQPPRTASAAAIPARVSPDTTVYRAGARRPGSTRTVPGRITSGSGPTRGRLAAYRAGQPPRTDSAAAIPARVSPDTTVYRAGARRPGSTRTVPGRITSGSGPTRGRLAAYSAGQPPRTASA